MKDFDCVVVGAGWYGLAAAAQFHATQPDSSLVVYDSQSSLGGTWAKERLYPGLKSNNLLGTYEYPGFPMTSDLFDVEPGKHISGQAVHAYLRAYAKKSGISDMIHLNTKVLSAEHQDTIEGGWILTIEAPSGCTTIVLARRLVFATGLTSEAFLPHFDGQEVFGGRIFHGKHFQENADTLRTAKAATVFGGTKSAWDAAYAYATAGVKVNWVIRSSGHGPCWMAPPYVTPFKKWIEKLANRRFLTWLSPCIWGGADGFAGIRRLYHGTTIGRYIVDRFWSTLEQDICNLNEYDAHPDTAKMKPWIGAMFTGGSFSLLNYDQDMMKLIKSDMIDVHIGEIDHLSPGKVHLADGTEFESDVFLASTGWKHVPPIKLLPEGIEKDLGIPHNTSDNAPFDDLGNNTEMLKVADKEITDRYPRLKRQPVWNKNYKPLTEQKGISSKDEVAPCAPLTSYMLYRFLVPPSPRFLRTRDTAFTGMISNFSNASTAYVSGLWISAYFQGKLTTDLTARAVNDKAALLNLQYQTVLMNRWGKWRYPTDWGNRHPSFIFDFVPYIDLLQRDLGLDPHRKLEKRSLTHYLTEIFKPYGPEDYQDITEEWLGQTKA
ncbi:hypothetical protein GGR50DRAFT_94321 [Xylaria sp. CBS 124048]|nr:hypothetical protein GGR50DRAFT_94321 [Xylaria sp. CBS 124048]